MSAVRGASALGQISRASVRDGGGLNALVTIKVRDATALRLVFSALSATAAPLTVTSYGNSDAPVDIVAGNCFATPAGGVAPFTFLWSLIAGAGSWVIGDDTNSLTSFTAEAVDPRDTRVADFKCAITDANGNEVETNVVTAIAINLGGG
jgi:hypothetical protein